MEGDYRERDRERERERERWAVRRGLAEAGQTPGNRNFLSRSVDELLELLSYLLCGVFTCFNTLRTSWPNLSNSSHFSSMKITLQRPKHYMCTFLMCGLRLLVPIKGNLMISLMILNESVLLTLCFSLSCFNMTTPPKAFQTQSKLHIT